MYVIILLEHYFMDVVFELTRRYPVRKYVEADMWDEFLDFANPMPSVKPSFSCLNQEVNDVRTSYLTFQFVLDYYWIHHNFSGKNIHSHFSLF